MRIEIVCIGDELLRGDTLNSNLAFLGEALTNSGLTVSRETCIPDERGEIMAAVGEALRRQALVITIGGLGPTRDDLTRQTVAELLGMPLAVRPEVVADIDAFLQGRAIPVPREAVRNQATIPVGARIMPNKTGTAPGLWCETENHAVVAMLPGPPRECQPMILNSLIPNVRRRAGETYPCVCSMVICGMPESAVENILTRILPPEAGLALGFCAKPEGLSLRLAAPPEAKNDLLKAEAEVRAAFGDHVLPPGCRGLVEHIGELLERRGWMLGLAESCTGGLIASRIADLAGVSSWFAGAAVTYSNDWKKQVLGVPESVLETYGAVSEPTVQAMLGGLRQRLDADAAVGVSGVAGPDGGSPEKPVGTVVIGVSVGGRKPCVTTHRFPGDRRTVRLRAMGTALVTLRTELLACTAP